MKKKLEKKKFVNLRLDLKMQGKQASDCFMKQKLKNICYKDHTKHRMNKGMKLKCWRKHWVNLRKHGNNNNTKGKIRFENQRFPTLNLWKRRKISFLRKKCCATSTWDSIVEQNRGWYHEQNQDNGESATKDVSYTRTDIQINSVNWRQTY